MRHSGTKQTVAAFVLGVVATAGVVVLVGQRTEAAHAKSADSGLAAELRRLAETNRHYALCPLAKPMQFVAADVKGRASYTVHVVAMSPKGSLYGLTRRAGGVAKWIRLTVGAPL